MEPYLVFPELINLKKPPDEERATEEGIGDAWWAYSYIAVGDYPQALQRMECRPSP